MKPNNDRMPIAPAQTKPAVPVAPPVYRPQPTPHVLQRKTSAGVMSTVQLSKKQQKDKARVEGKKKAKERKQETTKRNLSGYATTNSAMVNTYVDQGGVVGGHMSATTMSGMNNNTTGGIKNFENFKQKTIETQKKASLCETFHSYWRNEGKRCPHCGQIVEG